MSRKRSICAEYQAELAALSSCSIAIVGVCITHIALYQAAAAGTEEPLVKNRVLFSLGKTYEWLLQLDKARETYKEVKGIFQEDLVEKLRKG